MCAFNQIDTEQQQQQQIVLFNENVEQKKRILHVYCPHKIGTRTNTRGALIIHLFGQQNARTKVPECVPWHISAHREIVYHRIIFI